MVIRLNCCCLAVTVDAYMQIYHDFLAQNSNSCLLFCLHIIYYNIKLLVYQAGDWSKVFGELGCKEKMSYSVSSSSLIYCTSDFSKFCSVVEFICDFSMFKLMTGFVFLYSQYNLKLFLCGHDLVLVFVEQLVKCL